jgi:hypothetical protein
MKERAQWMPVKFSEVRKADFIKLSEDFFSAKNLSSGIL